MSVFHQFGYKNNKILYKKYFLVQIIKPQIYNIMSFKRSKSCIIKKSVVKDVKQLKKETSLLQLKINKKENQNKLFKRKILQYIQKRADIEIIIYFEDYREEFFRKSQIIQDLIYQQPEIRSKYLSMNNTHFLKGFQVNLLSLFRKRVLVQGSYKNMRMQAVQEIQKWVLSWIQRQIIYDKARQQQQQSQKDTYQVLTQLNSFADECLRQKMPF